MRHIEVRLWFLICVLPEIFPPPTGSEDSEVLILSPPLLPEASLLLLLLVILPLVVLWFVLQLFGSPWKMESKPGLCSSCFVSFSSEQVIFSYSQFYTVIIINTFLLSVRVAGPHRGAGLGVAVESGVAALIISLLPRSPLISLCQSALMFSRNVCRKYKSHLQVSRWSSSPVHSSVEIEADSKPGNSSVFVCQSEHKCCFFLKYFSF